jgi:uncharacterized membrane-anchored protein
MHPPRWTVSKVPEIAAYFWILRVLTTAMGEATSDFSVREIDPYVAVGLGAVAFWFAYIITRPLGASFADWMGVPRALGGLNWGRGRAP